MPALDFNRCYSAVSGRDARFDGQFVLAVRSTGIYCRPSCPARTPKPVNCTFFPTSAAAHLAGYRACKRCLPEAVPGSPTWNTHETQAARAMRLIGEGVVDREGVSGLANRLGYSERQLGRILTDQLGAPPLALARAQRAQTARHLLVGTTLSMSDVAFAAGFASIRQFNDTMIAIFGLTPTEVRSRARSGERTPNTPDAPATLTLRLHVREPFGGKAVVEWLAARAIVGPEHVDLGGPDDHTPDGAPSFAGASYTRVVVLARGMARVTSTPARDHVSMTATLEHLADLPELLALVRRLFDLDTDPVAIDSALARDPLVARSVAAAPGIRVPGAVDATELLVRAIVGQQVSVARARNVTQHLVNELGEPLPATLATATVSRAFPSPHAIATHAHELVRGPAARTRALITAMEAVAAGELTMDASRTLVELTADLESLSGIGPWTSNYVALRVLKHPDILLTGDSAVRAGARSLGVPHDPRGLADYSERHRPWRSYFMTHLWRAAAQSQRPGRQAKEH